jgi:serine O-acetyltransferase
MRIHSSPIEGAASPSLRTQLAEDLKANTGRTGLVAGILAAVSDPAFSTVLLLRIASRLHRARWIFLSKLVWRLNVVLTSCHIHPEASIGKAIRLPHPTGIVIGVGAQVGNDVTIYQNATIGRGLRDDRYPAIGDGAVIYPNAVVVGGIRIGRRSIIGAGSIVLGDIPDDVVASGSPAKVLRVQSKLQRMKC